MCKRPHFLLFFFLSVQIAQKRAGVVINIVNLGTRVV